MDFFAFASLVLIGLLAVGLYSAQNFMTTNKEITEYDSFCMNQTFKDEIITTHIAEKIVNVSDFGEVKLPADKESFFDCSKSSLYSYGYDIENVKYNNNRTMAKVMFDVSCIRFGKERNFLSGNRINGNWVECIGLDYKNEFYRGYFAYSNLLTNTNLFGNKDVECSRLGFGYNYNYSSDVCQKLSLDVADYSGCFSRKFEINKYVLPKNITCPNKDFIEVRNNENVLEQIEKAERYNQSFKIIYFNKECGIQIVRENWMGGYVIYNQDGFLRGYDNIENRNMTVCY